MSFEFLGQPSLPACQTSSNLHFPGDIHLHRRRGRGVMALIVVLAVMNGFQNELRERILGITSHVVVTSLRGSMSDYRDLLGQIKSEPEVVAATPYNLCSGYGSSQRGLAGAVVRGLDPKTAGEVINIAGTSRKASSPI